jgi:hypothetical protein
LNPYHRPKLSDYEWPNRALDACLHVTLEVALVALLSFLAVRRIERQHRTGPPSREQATAQSARRIAVAAAAAALK